MGGDRPGAPDRHRRAVARRTGQPGIDWLTSSSYGPFTDAVRERFDLVALDTRGSPMSLLDPRVRCAVPEEPVPTGGSAPPQMTDPSDVLAWAGRIAAACQAASGDILPFIGTEDVVRDIELLRRALGEENLSFVTYSYDTLTGVLYADRYPDRVRALITDAPMDPGASAASWYRELAVTLQAQLDAFLAACAADTTCAFHSDGRTRQAFDELMARLAEGPLDGLSADEVRSVVRLGLRDPDGLDEVLAALRAGNAFHARLVLEGALAGSDGSYRLARWCLDWDWPRDTGRYAALVEELRPVAPDFAWVAWDGLGCSSWPVGVRRTTGAVRAADAPPILIVSSTGDPMTPYPAAVSLSKELDHGVLVTRDGSGHGSMGLQDPCIDRITNAYLLDLELPATKTTCQ